MAYDVRAPIIDLNSATGEVARFFEASAQLRGRGGSRHGHSTERDFIYITTANPSPEQFQQLGDEVGPERSLLVLCTVFRGRGEYPNLTVKRIPKQVLSRCEWGHDDYSLRVENLPQKPPELGHPELEL